MKRKQANKTTKWRWQSVTASTCDSGNQLCSARLQTSSRSSDSCFDIRFLSLGSICTNRMVDDILSKRNQNWSLRWARLPVLQPSQRIAHQERLIWAVKPNDTVLMCCSLLRIPQIPIASLANRASFHPIRQSNSVSFKFHWNSPRTFLDQVQHD